MCILPPAAAGTNISTASHLPAHLSPKLSKVNEDLLLQLLNVTWLSLGTAPVWAEHLWKSQAEVG